MNEHAHITFPIDHFGIVSASLFAQLLNQSGDKRKRKTAFNAIRTMCKQFAMLPKDAEVESIALAVDAAGQIAYRVDYISECPHDVVERKSAPPPPLPAINRSPGGFTIPSGCRIISGKGGSGYAYTFNNEYPVEGFAEEHEAANAAWVAIGESPKL